MHFLAYFQATEGLAGPLDEAHSHLSPLGGCVDSQETGRIAEGAGRSQGLSAGEKRQKLGVSLAVSTAGRGRGAHTAPARACRYPRLAARVCWWSDATPLPPLLTISIRNLPPLPGARRPEPSGPGFSSWTRNTSRDALTPGLMRKNSRTRPWLDPCAHRQGLEFQEIWVQVAGPQFPAGRPPAKDRAPALASVHLGAGTWQAVRPPSLHQRSQEIMI